MSLLLIRITAGFTLKSFRPSPTLAHALAQVYTAAAGILQTGLCESNLLGQLAESLGAVQHLINLVVFFENSLNGVNLFARTLVR